MKTQVISPISCPLPRKNTPILGKKKNPSWTTGPGNHRLTVTQLSLVWKCHINKYSLSVLFGVRFCLFIAVLLGPVPEGQKFSSSAEVWPLNSAQDFSPIYLVFDAVFCLYFHIVFVVCLFYLQFDSPWLWSTENEGVHRHCLLLLFRYLSTWSYFSNLLEA